MGIGSNFESTTWLCPWLCPCCVTVFLNLNKFQLVLQQPYYKVGHKSSWQMAYFPACHALPILIVTCFLLFLVLSLVFFLPIFIYFQFNSRFILFFYTLVLIYLSFVNMHMHSEPFTAYNYCILAQVFAITKNLFFPKVYNLQYLRPMVFLSF